MAQHPWPTDTAVDIPPVELAEMEAVAVRLAREAGALLLDHFSRPLQVEYKSRGNRDPVTTADRRSEEAIRATLQKEFPDHGIVAEEGENQGPANAEFAWVVDPLDGTTNFLNHLPLWACSLGLLYRGRPVVAAVFLPAIDRVGGTILHAHAGGGAFQDEGRISVASPQRPDRGKLVSAPSYYTRIYRFLPPLQRAVGTVRSPGSTVYELAAVATGTFQYALFTPPRIWDVGAGVLLVQEAGGVVMTRTGGPWGPLTAFPGRGGDLPSLAELQRWRGPLLAGNREIAAFVAENLRQRPRYWLRLRRSLRSRWETLTGKATQRLPETRRS